MDKELVRKYVELAELHGESTCSGDYKKANRAYDLLIEHFRTIAKESSYEGLFELYSHKNPWVQLWSSSHTLEIDSELALDRLKTISDSGVPIVSMNARYTIQEWNKGKLSFL